MTAKNILDAASLAKWSIDIFDSLNEGLLIADKDGIVQYVNKQYLRIIGKKAEEILFRKLAEVRPGASSRAKTQRCRQIPAPQWEH